MALNGYIENPNWLPWVHRKLWSDPLGASETPVSSHGCLEKIWSAPMGALKTLAHHRLFAM